jgi:aerobic C4-dicarboxylate transport protein
VATIVVARWENELDTAQLAAALGGQTGESAPAAGLQPAE